MRGLQTWHTSALILNLLLRNCHGDDHYHPDQKPNHDMNPKPGSSTDANPNTDSNTHARPKATPRPNRTHCRNFMMTIGTITAISVKEISTITMLSAATPSEVVQVHVAVEIVHEGWTILV